jgi:hypothetical protein
MGDAAIAATDIEVEVEGDAPEAPSDALSEADRRALPLLQLRRGLVNACPGLPYTNFVSSFVACLDYIMVDGFDVVAVAPMPDRDTCERDTALPSWQFPSDHISIMADLRFRDKS